MIEASELDTTVRTDCDSGLLALSACATAFAVRVEEQRRFLASTARLQLPFPIIGSRGERLSRHAIPPFGSYLAGTVNCFYLLGHTVARTFQ